MFYKESTEYKLITEIQKMLDNNITPSARKLAVSLWLAESSTKTLQRKISTFEDKWYIIKTDTWRISWITEAWKVAFWLKELNIENTWTFLIPILWDIACWNPIEAIEDTNAEKIQISNDVIKWNPHDYFLLRARWDSMDKEWIESGDIVLIKKQNIANNWDIVVALIDDSATLKIFERTSKWFIALKPSSYNDIHKPIIMSTNFMILGKYITNIWRI